MVDTPLFHTPLSDAALDQLFRQARTHNAWQDRPVEDTTLRALADLLKWGPTSANCSPMRIVFVKSDAAKEKLRPLLMEGNQAKVMAAPVTALLGYDLDFPDTLPQLFPHTDARSWFAGNDALIEETAFRNSSLQGAYLILAARSLGLDTGPMSGFDKQGVEKTFFPTGRIKANFICSLGYGDPAGLFERSPRFDFDEFCSIV
ncbi:MAG: malonic semialdehyde reductase [Hyphomicrobiales bacterium]|nr:MAG: malonic semialdehyde reductase [Hyphomicrobiales bacterium]